MKWYLIVVLILTFRRSQDPTTATQYRSEQIPGKSFGKINLNHQSVLHPWLLGFMPVSILFLGYNSVPFCENVFYWLFVCP